MQDVHQTYDGRQYFFETKYYPIVYFHVIFDIYNYLKKHNVLREGENNEKTLENIFVAQAYVWYSSGCFGNSHYRFGYNQ